MENDEVKECWHQNVTQCHDTYITGYFYSSIKRLNFKRLFIERVVCPIHNVILKILFLMYA